MCITRVFINHLGFGVQVFDDEDVGGKVGEDILMRGGKDE